MRKDRYIALIINRHKGDISAQELKQLEDWLAADQANQIVANQILSDWEQSQLGAKTIEVDVDGDFEIFKARMAKAKQQQSPKAKVIPMRKTNRQWLWVAASVAVLIAALFAINNRAPKELILQAGISQTKNTTLADGTKVWLNKNSKLIYPNKFSDPNRRVKLQGEAYFEVAENKDQPFIIELDTARVKVLGTAFNIYEDEKQNLIQLSVSEGQVEFSSKHRNKKLIVSANEAATYSGLNESMEKDRVQPNASAWKSGILSFSGVKLQYVLEDVEKYFGRKVSLQNETLKDCIFAGNFPKPNVDGVLSFIANSFDMQLTQDRNGNYQLNEGECIQ